MAKKGKAQSSPADPAALPPEPAAPAPIPLSSAPLPLEELSAQLLGAFLELCFPDQRLLALCHELKLTTPGYRLESLPPDQVARVLADEARAAKDARALVETAVREALRDPVLEGRPFEGKEVDQLLDLVVAGDPLQHVARIAWRALLADDAAVRELAAVAIQDGINLLDAQAKKKPAREKAAPPPGVKEAEEALRRADRAEKERAQMKEQLAAARGEIAAREQRLAEERAELSQARAELARVSAELSRLNAAGEGRALIDARRNADEARALADKLKLSEAARAEAEARVQLLERSRAETPAAPAPTAPVEEVPTQEEAATFLVPVLTREFYD